MLAGPPTVYGKYQLLERLARGGMAEVFKAKSHGVEGFEKILVVKRILAHLSENPRFVEMFIQEAKISVTLNHANIVQVFDLGRADDSYFIAMEYVAGFNLAELSKLAADRGQVIPIELAVFALSEVAKGLDYAHRRRDPDMRPLHIVHRDISPQNVLVSFEGEVKLADFGIALARTSAQGDSAEHVVEGKFTYMAPEQARGERVDARADIFGCGAVLYELLSGRPAYPALPPYELLRRVTQGEHPPLREVAPHVAPALAEVVERAMSADPAQRWPTAMRLHEELIAFLYTTSRRVGAHDLSDFLKTLQAPSEAAPEVPSPEPEAVIPDEPLGPEPGELREVTVLAVETRRGALPADLAPAIDAIVARHGGTVRDRTGGGLIAFFGLGATDGREIESALRCATTLQQVFARDARTKERVSLGVETGSLEGVTRGVVPKDERSAALVHEARALAGATAGQIHVSADVHRAAHGTFELAESVALPTAWVVVGERPRSALEGRFIGRMEELQIIGGQLAFANIGQGRILAVTGEPGAGKTRLLHEARRRLREGGQDLAWFEASCHPFMRDMPLSGVQVMLRAILGIDENAPGPRALPSAERMHALGLSEDESAAVTALFGALRPATGTNTRAVLGSALLTVARTLSEERLTVLSWDSCGGLDAESMAVIDHLVRGIAEHRVLVTLTCRPGFVHGWSSLPGHHVIALGNLPPADARRLIRARLHSRDVPAALIADVTTRSGGNPLFVEQLLMALREAGAIEPEGPAIQYHRELAGIAVPQSLRLLVSSRVTGLTPERRDVLRAAAVIGPRFDVALLDAVAGTESGALAGDLEDLEERGIIRRSGPTDWSFSHALAHTVVYEAIPPAVRKALHGRVAKALEAGFPERVDEELDRLALHHREGGELAKAIDYGIRYADRRAAELAFDAAIPQYVTVVELLGRSRAEPRRLADVHRRAAHAAWRARRTDLGLDQARAARERADEASDTRGAVLAMTLTGKLLVQNARFGEALPCFDRAVEQARNRPDAASERDLLGARGEAHARNGEFSKAIGLLGAALEQCERAGDLELAARYRMIVAPPYAGAGDRDRAMANLATAESAFKSRGDRVALLECAANRAFVNLLLVDFQGCALAGMRALELAREQGNAYEIAAGACIAGEGYLRLGNLQKATTLLHESLEVSREHGFTKLLKQGRMLLGYIDAVKLGSDEGLSRIRDSLRYAEDNGYTLDATQAHYYLGLALRDRGDLADARRAFGESLRLGTEAGNQLYAVESEQLLGELTRLESDV